MSDKQKVISIPEFQIASNMLLCLIYIGLEKFFGSAEYDVNTIATVLCIGLAGYIASKSAELYFAKKGKKDDLTSNKELILEKKKQ